MKLNKTHRLHIAAHVVETLLDPEENSFEKVRMVRGVVKLSDEDGDSDYADFYYRGFRFEHNSDNTYCKWEMVIGRSSIDGRSIKGDFETLGEIKAHIDSKFYGPVQQKA